jgi:serine/threonine protein kinase
MTGALPEPGAGRLVADRYRVAGELSRDGTSTMWRADDQVVERQVALTELHAPPGPSAAGRAAFAERAVSDARHAARVHHPNVVEIYDVVPPSADDDAVYLVTELVQAPTLAEVVAREGTLPADRVARIGLQLLDALDAAHRLNVVHGAVTPANVLLAPDDQAKLTGFGIKHGLDTTDTPSDDLYSLGATLFYAAEGAIPTGQKTAMAVSGDPPLSTAISGLLTRDPAQRLTGARVRELMLSAAGTGTSSDSDKSEKAAGPISTPEARSARSGFPLKSKVLIVAVVVVLIAAIAVIAAVVQGRGSSSPASSHGPQISPAWSKTSGLTGSVVGKWGTADSVVVGSTSGFTAYTAASGTALWSWRVPTGDELCGMSPTTSNGIGAFDYGPPTATGDQCDYLQTIDAASVGTGWAQPVSTVDSSQVFGPDDNGADALSIDADVVTAPYLAADSGPPSTTGPNTGYDVMAVDTAGGRVDWTTDNAEPLVDGCTLDGSAAVASGTVYAVGACHGTTHLLSIDAATRAAVDIGPLRACDAAQTALAGSAITVSAIGGYVVANCYGTLYALAAGSTALVPLDMVGVDLSISLLNTQGDNTALVDAVADGSTLYLIAGTYHNDTGVIAVDMATGKQLWRTTVAPAGGLNVSLLSVSDGSVYAVASDTSIMVTGEGSSPGASLYSVRTSDGRATLLDQVSADGEFFSQEDAASCTTVGSYAVCTDPSQQPGLNTGPIALRLPGAKPSAATVSPSS